MPKIIAPIQRFGIIINDVPKKTASKIRDNTQNFGDTIKVTLLSDLVCIDDEQVVEHVLRAVMLLCKCSCDGCCRCRADSVVLASPQRSCMMLKTEAFRV